MNGSVPVEAPAGPVAAGSARAWIAQAELKLKEAGLPISEARRLAMKALNCDWAALLTQDALPRETVTVVEQLLNRRLNGEPLAYIEGFVTFCGLEIQTTPDALIPRPETETVVETALSLLPPEDCSVLDVGCGSGAIALAIKSQRPSDFVVAADLSAAAVNLALANSIRLNLNLQFVVGDLLGPFGSQKFDLVVSNPPYISTRETVGYSVTAEPSAALFAGETGDEVLVDICDALCDAAGSILNNDGLVILECGSAEQIGRVITRLGTTFVDCRVHIDCFGRERVISARLAPAHLP